MIKFPYWYGTNLPAKLIEPKRDRERPKWDYFKSKFPHADGCMYDMYYSDIIVIDKNTNLVDYPKTRELVNISYIYKHDHNDYNRLLKYFSYLAARLPKKRRNLISKRGFLYVYSLTTKYKKIDGYVP
jgi:hypothetical protein